MNDGWWLALVIVGSVGAAIGVLELWARRSHQEWTRKQADFQRKSDACNLALFDPDRVGRK